jgi:glycosyltransferase involved in cell wall biosynthesis
MRQQVIFISIDGLTDPLGQSQVLPYLTGLSKNGFDITIISCEKDANFQKNEKNVRAIIEKNSIAWRYCFYQNKIPFVSQRANLVNLRKLTEKEVREKGSKTILHCRSLMSAMIGLQMKNTYGTKYIFDMRGFWADERIDGNIWSLKNPIHYFLYKYFKRKEVLLLEKTDHAVTLTYSAKEEIQSWKLRRTPEIEVIPCCADTHHFNICTPEEKLGNRKNADIAEDAFVVGYLGSIGTWYMLDEMLDCFIEIKKKKKHAVLFFVTQDAEQGILEATNKKEIPRECILIRPAKRSEVPQYISTFNIGLFFIKPLYSKKGSSPTKLAELLACGVPVISNSGIGDCDRFFNENDCGVVVPDFSVNAYQHAVEQADRLLQKSPAYFRDIAITNFSLETGVLQYKKIYDALAQ